MIDSCVFYCRWLFVLLLHWILCSWDFIKGLQEVSTVNLWSASVAGGWCCGIVINASLQGQKLEGNKKGSWGTWPLKWCPFFVNRKEPVVLVVPLPSPGAWEEWVEICACSSEWKLKAFLAASSQCYCPGITLQRMWNIDQVHFDSNFNIW